MKLQPDRLDVQSILGYGPGWIGIGNQGVAEKIERSIVLGSRGEKFDWLCSRFEDLTAEHFETGRDQAGAGYFWQRQPFAISAAGLFAQPDGRTDRA